MRLKSSAEGKTAVPVAMNRSNQEPFTVTDDGLCHWVVAAEQTQEPFTLQVAARVILQVGLFSADSRFVVVG